MKKTRTLRFIFFLLIYLSVTKNGHSSTDSLSAIQFNSEFEKNVFYNLSTINNLSIFLAIDENMSSEKANKINNEINEFKIHLEKKKFKSATPEKQIKLLFTETHKLFFEKYENIADFNLIFDTKIYNCVSATALFSIILSDYNIPFLIKELPTHVYLVAFPNYKNIILESTAPKNGYFSPSDSDIEKAVNTLLDVKYVTQDEINQKGKKQVYIDFFYNDENITIKSLAGLQYLNKSILFLENEEYSNSLNAARKAFLLYPSKKVNYLKFFNLSNLLSNADYSNFNEITYLVEYANLSISETSNVTGSYELILQNQLFNQSNTTYVDSVFQYFSNNLKDQSLIKSISEIHYLNYAEFYYQKSEEQRAIEYAKKAFEINSQNVRTQSLIVTLILSKFLLSIGNISTEEKLNQYKDEFPFLEENILFQSFNFYNESRIAYQYFLSDDQETGFKYLGAIEKLRVKFGEKLKIDENTYGLVYAEAGAMYYRKRQYVKARDIIEKGLAILPNHPELKIRLEIVMDEL